MDYPRVQDPWRRPKGSRTLGTRLGNKQSATNEEVGSEVGPTKGTLSDWLIDCLVPRFLLLARDRKIINKDGGCRIRAAITTNSEQTDIKDTLGLFSITITSHPARID